MICLDSSAEKEQLREQDLIPCQFRAAAGFLKILADLILHSKRRICQLRKWKELIYHLTKIWNDILSKTLVFITVSKASNVFQTDTFHRNDSLAAPHERCLDILKKLIRVDQFLERKLIHLVNERKLWPAQLYVYI